MGPERREARWMPPRRLRPDLETSGCPRADATRRRLALSATHTHTSGVAQQERLWRFSFPGHREPETWWHRRRRAGRSVGPLLRTWAGSATWFSPPIQELLATCATSYKAARGADKLATTLRAGHTHTSPTLQCVGHTGRDARFGEQGRQRRPVQETRRANRPSS